MSQFLTPDLELAGGGSGSQERRGGSIYGPLFTYVSAPLPLRSNLNKTLILDVAKKLLSNQYQSVVYNHLEDDYQLYVKSCMKQLNEAAATTLEETDGDLTYGITDFSDKEIAEEFKLAQSKGA